MMDTSNIGAANAAFDRAYYNDEVRCFVPSCKKYRRDHPNVGFLTIPKALKATWCLAVERNCPKRPLHVCEEHVNVEQDCYNSKDGKQHLKKTANLLLTRTYYYKKMKSKSKTSDDKIEENQQILRELPSESTQLPHVENLSYSKCDSASQCEFERKHKAAMIKPVVRSVGCAANIKAVSFTTKIMPSQPIQIPSSSGSSTPTLFSPSSSSSSSSSNNKENIPAKHGDFSGRQHIMSLIKEKPKMYIGVPKQYYWLLDFLAKECNLNVIHIVTTLFKIKQNDTLQRIADHFDFSKVTVQKILRVCMPHLATYLQNFIYLPEPIEIKKTLPPVFKARYANVQCIIDCFEIQIEKPSDPVTQARTWSQYKSCNTLKYLIACCPNGFICFISKGYGGRISDKAITDCSGFVDILPPGAVVLADRGFKGIDIVLKDRHVKLLRPPSVSSSETPTKKEVIKSKIIASLRIHVERVIRRVREFSFLKPHSVINHSHIRYVDESVTIACALANLQGDIIKIQ